MKATLYRIPETPSTNLLAIEMLSKDRPDEGFVVITDHQTNGKGMDTNHWESEKGKNLTFSLVLYPPFAADRQFLLNKAISLGIYDFLQSELPEQEVSIKWPNDIYIGDKKACGMLIQNSVIGNRLEYVIVGIGLNVNQTAFTSNAPNPVSMKMITAKDYNQEELLQVLLQCIFERYMQLKQGLGRVIETDYKKALYRIMEWHEYLVKGNRIRARINGTNMYGQLMLETETDSILICDLKEIKFNF